MPKIKAELMTTPIKFYLRQFVTKAGVEPRAIPSERSLCARFNVARGTVRDAICQLEEDEVLIRLPGRKGVFSNPLFHTSPIWTVGLIAHGNGGYASEFPFEVGILQSGFFPAMPRDSFFCNIMFPDRFPEEELFRFFSNQNLDAMVWFGPGEFYAGLIAGLVVAAAMLLWRTEIFGGMHFLLIVPFLLVFSLSVIWAVSRTAPAPRPDKLIDTTFSAADFRAETRSLAEVSWWRNYRVWGGVLLVLCMLILIIFR